MIKASSDKPVEPLPFFGRYENAVSPYSNNGIKNNLRTFGGFFKGFFATFCAALAHCQKVAPGGSPPPDCLMARNTPFSAGSTMFSD